MSSRMPITNPLKLEYPQSLAVYDEYTQAQKAVDFLSDNKFPVEQCMIVGTDLKRVDVQEGLLRSDWLRNYVQNSATGVLDVLTLRDNDILPSSGTALLTLTQWAAGLSTVTGCGFAPNGRFYATEFSATNGLDGSGPGEGAVVLVPPHSTTPTGRSA